MSSYSDQEVLIQIKKANKDILIHLYKTYEPVLKKIFEAKGASDDDTHALLEDTLVLFWDRVQQDHFVLNEGLKVQLPQLAEEIWEERVHVSLPASEDKYIKQDEKLKKFIAANTSIKYVSYNRGKVGVSIPLFALASVAVIWVVLEYKPVEIRTIAKLIKIPSYIYFNKPEAQDSVTSENNIMNQDFSHKKTYSNFRSQDSAAFRNDTSGMAYNTASFENSDNPKDTIQEEEIIVRKDMLLSIKSLKPIDKTVGSTEADADDKSLAKELAEKMNPEAKVPDYESKSFKTYQIELWKSPVNFKGYKMSKSKIVLYGLEDEEALKLYSVNDNLYLNYHNNIYKLEETEEFEPFNKIKDTGIFTLLK
jgi:hypothetical protein